MGNRANMVVVENGEWVLYDGRWAPQMLDVVAFGPEYAVSHIRAHDESEAGWTDPVSADGGVLVDLDRRRLLFFGEELASSMDERRAIFDVLPRTWPGYEVGWAYGGTDEIVDYVGAERHWKRGRDGIKIERVGHYADMSHLVSVETPDRGLRMWQLRWGYSAAWQGPSMLNTLSYKGVKQLRRHTIPESGVHVDVDARTVGVWTTSEARGLFDLMPERWPGWRTECWDDRYEEHVARCGGSLRVPSLDLVQGLATVRHWLHQRVFGACEDRPAGAWDAWTKTRDPARPARGWDDHDDYGRYVSDSPFRPTPQDWQRFVEACEGQRRLYAQSA
jgi:hypothetical protein